MLEIVTAIYRMVSYKSYKYIVIYCGGDFAIERNAIQNFDANLLIQGITAHFPIDKIMSDLLASYYLIFQRF